MDSTRSKLIIQYWGGWGYGPKAERAKQLINEQMEKGTLDIDLKMDHGITGNFELILFNSKNKDGRKVHSKQKGDGFITGSNLPMVLARIEDNL